jgi:hypothetical protein
VAAGRILAVVERELSVPVAIWQGHRLIDREEGEEDAPASAADPAQAQRNLEHVFALLGTVYPREPMQVALHGLRSEHAGLRGLAVEYLESVLPPSIQIRLWKLVEATPDASREKTSPEQALEQLRMSQQVRVVSDDDRRR